MRWVRTAAGSMLHLLVGSLFWQVLLLVLYLCCRSASLCGLWAAGLAVPKVAELSW